MGKQDKPEVETPSRYVKRALTQAIARATAPVVVLEGARGTGKTALVKNEEAFKGYRYVTLADEETFARASAHPADWLALLRRPVIIDDAHRVPGLLDAAQKVAPQRRVKRPSLVLVTPERLPDSFAELRAKAASSTKGSAPKLPPMPERFTLFPLTQAEINGRTGCIIDDLFDGNVMQRFTSFYTRSDLRTMMRVGGHPARVLHPVRALSQSDESEVLGPLELLSSSQDGGSADADIDRLIAKAVLEKLLTNPGISLSVDAVAAACSVDADTLTEYLTMLENRFLIHTLTMLDKKQPQVVPFAKTRVHSVDTMFVVQALRRAGHDVAVEPSTFAKALRTLCLNQLIPAVQWANEPTEYHHWKKFAHRMREVDLVLKRGKRLVGITIRNSMAARHDTVGSLRLLVEDERFERGFILYMGATPRRLTAKIWALPVSALWEPNAFFPGLSNLWDGSLRAQE